MARRQKKIKGTHYGTKNCGVAAVTAAALCNLMKTFSHHFKLVKRDQTKHAKHYLLGITKSDIRKKNIERIDELDKETSYQNLHHFIGASTWNSQNVFDHVAEEASKLIGGKDAAIVIDESGIQKKGDKSVGVARQWLGSVGKVDNGQVGVFASLVNGADYALIGGELYLPESWTGDKTRMTKAKVPEERQVFKTKTHIAKEMIEHFRTLNVEYGWVCGDALYGKDYSLLEDLNAMGERFLIDVHANTNVWFGKPRHKSTKNHSQRQRVDEWTKEKSDDAWEKITARKGTKGDVVYEYLFENVWFKSSESETFMKLRLVVRRDAETKGDYKYSLSNASAKTGHKKLAYVQAERYWVERTFQDAKQSCGMDKYQVRTWVGWHHHMAMVAMAMLFMLQAKRDHARQNKVDKDAVRLSCFDITQIITLALASQPFTEEDVEAMIRRRHKQRARNREHPSPRKT